jgi:type 1 glutamine amidotransferase
MNHPTRRDVLKWSAAVAGTVAGTSLLGRPAFAADDAPKKKILFFTKSSGYQHSVIDRYDPKTKTMKPLAYAEQILIDLGAAHGFDVTASKDGSLFTPEKLAPFDALVFYTTGDLATAGTDKQPPMPAGGKQALIDFVSGGKGLIGLHCASDTFHSHGDEVDPYIKLLGGEFIIHGNQQVSTVHVVEPDFPGAPAKDATFKEEWYSLKNFADDLDVILVQRMQGMDGPMYKRGDYPSTWCRIQEKGRVFYSSMGHREDVWKSAVFTDLLVGAMTFVTGQSKYTPKPNLKTAAPDAGK